MIWVFLARFVLDIDPDVMFGSQAGVLEMLFLSFLFFGSIEIYLIIIITVYIFNPENIRFYPKLQV